MRHSLFALLTLAFGTLALHAQQADEEDFVEEPAATLDDVQLIIEKEAELSLPTASRNFGQMQKLLEKEPNTSQRYNLQLVEYRLRDITPQVSYFKLPKAEAEEPLNGMVKAGFGVPYLTPYFEGFYNGGSGQTRYGLHARHLSSLQGPVEDENSAAHLTDIGGDLEVGFGNAAFDLAAGYERHAVNYYGFAENAEVLTDSIDEQVYNLITAKAGIRNASRDAKFDYALTIGFHTIGDEFEASETNVDIGYTGDVVLSPDMEIETSLGYVINNYSSLNLDQSRNAFRGGAAFHYRLRRFRFRAGAQVALNQEIDDLDALEDETAFHFYPDVTLEYDLVPNRLSVKAEAGGGLDQRDLRTLSFENPFLDTENALLLNESRDLDLSLGLLANLTEELSATLKGRFVTYDNMGFFVNSVNDPASPSKFGLIYDDVSMTEISADVNYVFGSKVRLAARASFMSFNLDSLDEAWHRPNFEGAVLLRWNATEKLAFDAEFFTLGGIKAQGFDETGAVEAVDLDPIFDLNLRGDYRIGERFSVFVSLNNAFAQTYQRYYLYDRQGIQAMLGGTFSF